MLFFVSSSIVFSLLALLYALCMLLCALLLGVVNIFDLHLSKKKHLKNNFKKVLEQTRPNQDATDPKCATYWRSAAQVATGWLTS